MVNSTTRHFIEFHKEGCVYASPDQTILEAAVAAGVPLFHVCGGNAKCSTCRVLVIEGAEWLTPPNEKERHLNNQMHFPCNVRLGCQTHITGGPIKLTRIIQDETDIGIYVGSFQGASSQQIGEMEGTFSKPMDMGNGKVIQPTGKKFKLSMSTIARWKYEKMIEEYLHWDNYTIMKQIGAAQ